MHRALSITSQHVTPLENAPLSRTEPDKSTLALAKFATDEAQRPDMTENPSDPSLSASIADPRVISDDREEHRADSTGAAPTARSAGRKPTARDALMTPDRATAPRQSQSPRSDTAVREETREIDRPRLSRRVAAGGAGAVADKEPSTALAGNGWRMSEGPRPHADVGKDTHIERGEHSPAGAARAVQVIQFQPDTSKQTSVRGIEGKADVVRAPPVVAPAPRRQRAENRPDSPTATRTFRASREFWANVEAWAISRGVSQWRAGPMLISLGMAASMPAPEPEQLTHEGKPWRVLIRERRNRLTSR